MLKALAGGLIMYLIVVLLSGIIEDAASVVLLLNIILTMIVIGCTDIIVQTIKKYSNKTSEKEKE